MKAQQKLKDPRASFFLKYDCGDVDMYTVPWMMKNVLRWMNIEEDISCNSVSNLSFYETFALFLNRDVDTYYKLSDPAYNCKYAVR